VVPESSLEWRSSGIPRIYFLGRFDTYNKGLDLLVASIAQILKAHPVQLTLQGPEWGDREALKAQVQTLGIQDHVTFLEPDYQNSPAALALKYDIFTVPSRFEGFSLSALEAMLAGRVIVISEVAGLAPHVEASEAGLVVQPTVESIVSALLQLLECRDRWPDMGRSGRSYALNELQWKKIAQSALMDYQH
jgi:glycosyltransferase involved in cell wall biosynthesis